MFHGNIKPFRCKKKFIIGTSDKQYWNRHEYAGNALDMRQIDHRS